MKKTNKNIFIALLPIMLGYFAMGFVDSVGIATNYVKDDFQLSDSLANIFTSMVFFWFLICSIPTGMLMNKIGRRKTVLISLAISLVAVLLPLIKYDLIVMTLSFSLLGIGNAIMQVSINPLLSNIVSKEKYPSFVTLGQLMKAIAAFAGPIIATHAAIHFGNWRLLYVVFLIEGILAFLFLSQDKITEDEITGKASTFKECFALLGDKLILICFLGIVCHVGIDVGINLSAPKLVMEKLKLPLSDAGYSTSIYFFFRTIGSLIGVIALAKYSMKKFFVISVLVLMFSMFSLLIFNDKTTLYICFALIGLGNANMFPIMFSQAIMHLPHRKNEVSGLMIMGIFGGTVFPLIMGLSSDAIKSQSGAVAVMLIGVLYLLSITNKVKK